MSNRKNILRPSKEVLDEINNSESKLDAFVRNNKNVIAAGFLALVATSVVGAKINNDSIGEISPSEISWYDPTIGGEKSPMQIDMLNHVAVDTQNWIIEAAQEVYSNKGVSHARALEIATERYENMYEEKLAHEKKQGVGTKGAAPYRTEEGVIEVGKSAAKIADEENIDFESAAIKAFSEYEAKFTVVRVGE